MEQVRIHCGPGLCEYHFPWMFPDCSLDVCVPSLLSLLADSVMRWNKFVNTADRVFASSIFLAFPVRPIMLQPVMLLNNNNKLAYAGHLNSCTRLRALLVLHDRGFLANVTSVTGHFMLFSGDNRSAVLTFRSSVCTVSIPRHVRNTLVNRCDHYLGPKLTISEELSGVPVPFLFDFFSFRAQGHVFVYLVFPISMPVEQSMCLSNTDRQRPIQTK
jgi:hypothetical protein